LKKRIGAYPSTMRLLAIVASALALSAPVFAAPPQAGLLVPGRSLGGLTLDATRTEVERAWGRAYGVCTGCPRETWYFNYYAFQPRGAGVEFRNGRASAIFTIHSPSSWHTAKGLALGDPVAAIASAYGTLTRLECGSYHAFLLPRARSLTVFYVLNGRLWAFGLLSSGVQVCR
jgi:hypothetical protein